MQNQHRRPGRPALIAIATSGVALLAMACDGLTNAGDRGPVSLSLALNRAGLTATSSSVQANDGQHELVLTSVQVTLDEIELERVEGPEDGDSDTESDTDSDSDGNERRHERFATGPVVVDLPVDGGMISPVTVPIPEGRYEEIELEIDRVRVRGFFDGQPFDVTIPVGAQIEGEFHPPFRVDSDDDRVNITISVRAIEWFRNPDGTLVDPRRVPADPVLLGQVRTRILASLRAFEDSDRDGDEEDSDSDSE